MQVVAHELERILGDESISYFDDLVDCVFQSAKRCCGFLTDGMVGNHLVFPILRPSAVWLRVTYSVFVAAVGSVSFLTCHMVSLVETALQRTDGIAGMSESKVYEVVC
jgi:hypothetical protein